MLPVHEPLQRMKRSLAAGTAVSRSSAPWSHCVVHVAAQSTPGTSLVTVPGPPLRETASATWPRSSRCSQCESWMSTHGSESGCA